MRKRALAASLAASLAAAAIVAASGAGPVGAVTNGEFDGDRHPHVVLVRAKTLSGGGFRCTGTQISATFVLTAGHCVTNFPDIEDPVVEIRVFIEADVEAGIGSTNNYPDAGPNAIEAVRWATHPLYETAPFFVNDVGMIELAEARELDTYGTLPAVNSLDRLAKRRGTQNVTFTAVGYGLQQINPVFIVAERTRMVAYPKLNMINAPGFTGDFSLLLSNNHSTGGTCFGDSGGPNFLGASNVVAGVTSFGINGNCAGTGGVFRVDRQNVQDFIAEFVAG